MTCSYSKEYSNSAFTDVENTFIFNYVPLAEGDAVKVYLYGLFLCKNPALDQPLEEIAKTLDMTEEQILKHFAFWEEYGLVSIISKSPLSVKYLPVRSLYSSKPRKFKTEKYADFTKSVQFLISSRMISTSEYSEYFSVMETYNIKPEAMLMIIRYCIDRKGTDIGYRYIIKVAKDFGNRGVITVDSIEKELSSYVLRTAELEKILSALSLRRQPDIDDLNLLKKWTVDLNFEITSIIYAAKTIKKGGMEKLDSFLMELYSHKCFTKEEIASYTKSIQSVYDLAIKINKALSIYVEVISTVVNTYTSKWLSYGFEENTLLLIANHCFTTGNNSLSFMDEEIEALRNRGIIDLTSVSDFYENEKRTEKFLSTMLRTAGVNRRPNKWDKDNLNVWTSWNFSQEMILEAAKISSGKNNPLAYMNGVLSNWKNNGVFTLDNINLDKPSSPKDMTQEAYNAEYSHRRNVAIIRAQNNLEKARELQGFSTLYERTFSIEKDLAFAEIAQNDELIKTLEEEKILVNEKIDKLLKTISLTQQDLTPQYRCRKCGDTGYVGTNRCDCL